MVFYPTSPFRSVAMIDLLAGKLAQGYSSVTTTRKIVVEPGRFVRHGENGPVPVGDGCRRTFFRQLGLAYGLSRRTPFGPAYNYGVEDPIQAIDIDTMADLALARLVIEYGLWGGDRVSREACRHLGSVGSEIAQRLVG